MRGEGQEEKRESPLIGQAHLKLHPYMRKGDNVGGNLITAVANRVVRPPRSGAKRHEPDGRRPNPSMKPIKNTTTDTMKRRIFSYLTIGVENRPGRVQHQLQTKKLEKRKGEGEF